eukprot:TRINITY_DN27288_c0_g2_i1.p1 TRINITY_DN27288_c0_g2~~TRINITY_DN27288_c0_g2_i1.p1  ORF type:complete len:572 (+),score=74.06 TRINITY_DN27288_c0_g2_i1:39-1718(+)
MTMSSAATPRRAIADVVATLQRGFVDQAAMVRLFLKDRRMRTPMVAIWVASFGGALHDPITTFFTLELGATTTQIGTFGVIKTTGAWLLGPVYGWMIDSHSAFLPSVVSAFACTVGCALRGFTPANQIGLLYASAVVLGLGASNFWNVVGAHVACATEKDMRALVVSAYSVQVQTLQLLGKSVYPAWDAALQLSPILANDRLLRYRVTMSVCTFFCVFGVINLLINGHPMKEVKGEKAADTSAKDKKSSVGGASNGGSNVAAGDGDTCRGAKVADESVVSQGADREVLSAVTPPVTMSSWGSFWPFAASAAVLVVQAAGFMAVQTLWPLYIRHQFQWHDHGYAALSLAGSLMSILATFLMPAFAQRAGVGAVATMLCGAAAVGALIGFPARATPAVHVAGALVFISSAAALKPCLEASATISVVPSLQGRSFALLSLCNAGGQMLGSYVGAVLFEDSVADAASPLPQVSRLPVLTDGGALPFVLVGGSLAVSTTVLAMALLPHGAPLIAGTANASAADNGCDDGHAAIAGKKVSQAAAEQELSGLLHRAVQESRRPAFD